MTWQIIIVSMLRKYRENNLHVLNISIVLLDENLGNKEDPVAILDIRFEARAKRDRVSVGSLERPIEQGGYLRDRVNYVEQILTSFW